MNRSLCGSVPIGHAVLESGAHDRASLTNHLLASLPGAGYGRLFPSLELIAPAAGWALYEAGRKQGYVYFPTDSIVPGRTAAGAALLPKAAGRRCVDRSGPEDRAESAVHPVAAADADSAQFARARPESLVSSRVPAALANQSFGISPASRFMGVLPGW